MFYTYHIILYVTYIVFDILCIYHHVYIYIYIYGIILRYVKLKRWTLASLWFALKSKSLGHLRWQVQKSLKHGSAKNVLWVKKNGKHVMPTENHLDFACFHSHPSNTHTHIYIYVYIYMYIYIYNHT